jgi:hypothetical protein
VYIQLLKHLSKNNVLAEEQFGFRIKPTTEKAIHKLTNEILNALNSKFKVGGIFCGLKKAFDVLTITFYYPN